MKRECITFAMPKFVHTTTATVAAYFLMIRSIISFPDVTRLLGIWWQCLHHSDAVAKSIVSLNDTVILRCKAVS